MGNHHLITFKVGYAGRSFEIRMGRKAVFAWVSAAALVLVLLAQGIYDIRDNLAKLGELRALRARVSEQDLALQNLHVKFEGLVGEVDRLRSMHNRLKSLDENNNPIGGPAFGVGGVETPERSAAVRLDRLLDRKFDRLRSDLLVEVENLDLIGERLDTRRLLLESVPAGWPVRGFVSSAFGMRRSPFTGTPVFHQGIDIAAAHGAPVVATAPGIVVKSGFEALPGNLVVLDHGSGYRSVYAHLASRRIEEGDFVERGQELGQVGSTGRATGPHLHYEIRVDGLQVNPARFLE